MRHRKKTIKLGRTTSHREAMLSGMVCSLIKERQIQTTLPKARAARSLAEKMVTLGKKGDLAARRRAISKLQQKDAVQQLFDEIAPKYESRQGGYTRIMKLGKRSSDSSEMALLEWVEAVPVAAPKAEPASDEPTKEAAKKPAKKAAKKPAKKAAKKPAKKAAKKPAKKKAAAKKTDDGSDEGAEASKD